MAKTYKGILMDLDGTTYFGSKRIPSAEEFIKKVQAKEMPLQFITNNATQTSDEISHKLKNNYDLSVSPESIYTSIVAMIDYLSDNHSGESIYVIGEEGLNRAIEEAGFEINQTPSANVVVQGLNRQTHYAELSGAVQAIRNGATFLVTNTDNLIPTDKGLQPSSGAITAFLEYATKVESTVMGKPNKPIVTGALSRLGLERDEVLLIGDNYATDIQAGINANIDTLLVLTGVTQADEVDTLIVPPTYVVDDLTQWEI